MKARKKMCGNCKHSGKGFKIDKMTHYHCEDKEQFTQEGFDRGEFTPWDTLRKFSEDCGNHQFKNQNVNQTT